jgi:hypothetical protein
VQPYRIEYPITVSESISPTPAEYILDPIHPWLLRLLPGEPDSFLGFVDAVGIHEFLDWAYGEELTAWTNITETLDAVGYLPPRDALSNPWADAETIRIVAQKQFDLSGAYNAATNAVDLDRAMDEVLAMGWGGKQFRIEIDLDPVTRTLVERPADLWARGWFELLDGLNHGLPPTLCSYCRTAFTPNRSSQEFCLGYGCSEKAYEQKRSRTRRKYHKEYQRKRRKKLKDIEERRGGDTRGINQEEHNQEG